MFAAQIPGERTQIIAYAERWNDRLGELRRMVASGRLVCPGCEQPLWLRTGMRRRRHFAHRSLSDCPLANQSAEVLEAKRQLFDWLETKYPGRVRYDSTVDGCAATPPADVLVATEKNGTSLYWVFDRQQRDRARFLRVPAGGRVHAHFLHTRAALTLTDDGELALTASQREFMTVSDFDRATRDPHDGHLHFILTDEGRVRIYRGLRCTHAPQRFSWQVMDEAVWCDAMIKPGSGEIVLGSDELRWRAWKSDMEAERQRQEQRERAKVEVQRQRMAAAEANRQRMAEAARRQAEAERVRVESRQRPAPPPQAASPALRGTARVDESRGLAGQVREGPAAEPRYPLAQRLRCEDCGADTADWAVATPHAGTCVCHACTYRRWEEKQKTT